MILKQSQDDKSKIENNIREVLAWRIKSEDNILRALLIYHFDELAIEYMGYYFHFLDEALFIYCMKQGNTIFLKNALIMSAFDKMIFREDNIIT